MTVLQSLHRYYDRMAARGEVDASEFSREKISLRVVLSPEGAVRRVLDIRELGKKRMPQMLNVPAAVKRTVAILPNRFWDKTSYALGRTAGPGRRTAEEHAAFKTTTLALIGESNDPGLLALRRFLETWQPEDLDAHGLAPELMGSNVVFQLEDELRDIHARDAARVLLGRAPADAAGHPCLISGVVAPIVALHPSIKGVWGAQSSGASLVSFNQKAFESYGKEQGDNAPSSEAAAARYGGALNRMLDRNSRNRLPRPLGDAAVVFWADTSDTVDETAAAAAEDWAAVMLEPPADDASEAKRVGEALALLAAGRPLTQAAPGLEPGTRFHVLGLSPNAARLSVRFWFDDTFDAFAERLAEHYAAVHIEPAPWRDKPPSVSRLLVRTTALLEDFKNIPPLLAGEVMRAILSGTPYPRAWLAASIVRLRAGDDPATGWHAAVARAVLARTRSEETPPVSLEPENPDPAYQLGRLFAVLEAAQREALGQKINATVADRYYGAASATPARVFGPLLRGARNHIADATKRNKGFWINARLEQIIGRLGPDLPRTLRLEDQGRFAIGYYHERASRPRKSAADETVDTTSPQETE